MNEPKWLYNATASIDFRIGEADREDHALAPECPACGADLHYSSGWERRVCTLCTWVEGEFDYQIYPRGLPWDQYHFLLGQTYWLRQQRHISQHEFCEMVYQIAPYGSFYRPPMEND